MAGRSLIVEVSEGICNFAFRSLVPADIISVENARSFLGDVELCADTVFLEESTSSSLEFGNLVPESRVSVSREVWRGRWDLAGIGMHSGGSQQEGKGRSGHNKECSHDFANNVIF